MSHLNRFFFDRSKKKFCRKIHGINYSGGHQLFQKSGTVHGNSQEILGFSSGKPRLFMVILRKSRDFSRKTLKNWDLVRFSFRKHSFPMENHGFRPQNMVLIRKTLRKHGFYKENLKKTRFPSGFPIGFPGTPWLHGNPW